MLRCLFFSTAAAAIIGLAGAGVGAEERSEVYGPQDKAASAETVDVFYPDGVPMALVNAGSVAARQHPLVAQALANRRTREAQRRGAKWLRFPSLSVEGLAVTQGSQVGTQDGLAANVILEQPLYTFGRINGSIAASDAALETSTHAVHDAQMEILMRTISAYFDLAVATQREEILKNSLQEHQTLLETIRRRVLQDVSPVADLELANSRVAQLEQDIATVAGVRATSFSRLQELVGYADIDFGGVPWFYPDTQIAPEEELVEAALKCSPLLKALGSTRREREAQRKVARARIFPQVVAQASTNEITGARLGVTLRLQTGNGLSQLAAVDAASSDIQSVQYEAAAAEREIREQIRIDFQTFVAGRDRVRASSRATRASDLVTDSYRRQFIAGRRTWLDVMNAVRESANANLTESEAGLGALAAYSRIMARSCLWQIPSLGLEAE